PGSAALDATANDEADSPATGGIPIRLRGVRSEPFLRERIVWRVSDVEYGLYEQRRWIDLPAHYVEHALRTRLRETPGLQLTNDLRAVVLHVDVLAFDDVLAPTHAANVALGVALEDPMRGRLFVRTFNAQVGIENGEPASIDALPWPRTIRTSFNPAATTRPSRAPRSPPASGWARRGSWWTCSSRLPIPRQSRVIRSPANGAGS